jgi:hypothetical protein
VLTAGVSRQTPELASRPCQHAHPCADLKLVVHDARSVLIVLVLLCHSLASVLLQRQAIAALRGGAGIESSDDQEAWIKVRKKEQRGRKKLERRGLQGAPLLAALTSSWTACVSAHGVGCAQG